MPKVCGMNPPCRCRVTSLNFAFSEVCGGKGDFTSNVDVKSLEKYTKVSEFATDSVVYDGKVLNCIFDRLSQTQTEFPEYLSIYV